MRNAYRSHLQRGDKTVKIKSQCCREMLRKVDVETKVNDEEWVARQVKFFQKTMKRISEE